MLSHITTASKPLHSSTLLLPLAHLTEPLSPWLILHRKTIHCCGRVWQDAAC